MVSWTFDEYKKKLINKTMIGFALRGNKDIPQEKEDCENAEDQAVDWFKKFLD